MLGRGGRHSTSSLLSSSPGPGSHRADELSVCWGVGWHHRMPSPRLPLSLSPGPQCLPLGAQPASSGSLMSSRSQQEQRLGCAWAWGPGGAQSLPSLPGLPGGQVVGVGLGGSTGGGIFKGCQSGHCRPPDPQRLHREPQCPGAHLAPFTGTVPAHTGTGPSLWGGGRMSFYSRHGQFCQGWLGSHGACDRERER